MSKTLIKGLVKEASRNNFIDLKENRREEWVTRFGQLAGLRTGCTWREIVESMRASILTLWLLERGQKGRRELIAYQLSADWHLWRSRYRSVV